VLVSVDPLDDVLVSVDPLDDVLVSVDPLDDVLVSVEPLVLLDVLVSVEPMTLVDPLVSTDASADVLVSAETLVELPESVETVAEPLVSIDALVEPLVSTDAVVPPATTELVSSACACATAGRRPQRTPAAPTTSTPRSAQRRKSRPHPAPLEEPRRLNGPARCDNPPTSEVEGGARPAPFPFVAVYPCTQSNEKICPENENYPSVRKLEFPLQSGTLE